MKKGKLTIYLTQDTKKVTVRITTNMIDPEFQAATQNLLKTMIHKEANGLGKVDAKTGALIFNRSDLEKLSFHTKK